MKTTKLTVLAIAASAAISWMSAVRADDVSPADAVWAENMAVTKCQWCHGPQGHSNGTIYPQLAGQKAWYIVEQLHAFKDQSRADPYARGIMWGMAAQLTDTQINALADYFSKQTPFGGQPVPFQDAAAVSHGKSVYSEGVAAAGVAPCSACHQDDARGNDQFPRLAGQHASYLLKQLRAFHSGAREQAVMNGIVGPLQEPDMKAVAAYLESLH
ncbi:MAG: c-type cytochrome [Steroidobacteraceae bacterium]|jgi:cytochrome c553